jgi:tyrosine-protein kinase SgK223
MPSLGASIHSAWGSLHTVPGGLYTQSLAHLVTKCEDLFMGGQKKELSFKEKK